MSANQGWQPKFQTVGSGDYPRIATREEVHRTLAIYSDHLNWNVEPEIEIELRATLCKIYGHSPYSGFTWKPLGYCYWCFQKVLTDEEVTQQRESLPPMFREWHAQ